MKIEEYLRDYIHEVQPVLEEFFCQKIKEAKKISPLAHDMIERFSFLNASGKRVRGALVKLGYQCYGGKDLKNILIPSAAIEILHSALLVQDDVIDKSDIRRGSSTIHKQYEGLYRQSGGTGNAKHYGLAAAFIIGDIGILGSFELLSQANFDRKNLLAAIGLFARYVIDVGYGEVMDVDFAMRKQAKAKDVLLVHKLKTSQYTILAPLQIGALLSGAGKKDLADLAKYALPCGLAFQIHDDILGMFGTQTETGKPATDDLREGKNTLLIIKARENANFRQRKVLDDVYGRPDADFSDVERVREIMRETGALRYSENSEQQLIAKAKRAIPGIAKNTNLAEIFGSLADFVVGRKG